MPNRAAHRKRPARHRLLKRVVAITGVLVVVVAVGLVVIVRHLDGNITGLDISKHLGHNRPTPKVTGAVNVLVMGDDTRKGQGPKIGGETPGLSDTTILLHLSANRKFAYGVSLPRDAMVQRPPCDTTTGVDPGGLTQFNEAYAIGGPACTIKTVEHLTGVPIDHFVVVKFRGFKNMVDAIGGVEVCVPEEINDDYMNSNIHFRAGTYTISGEQALNYVRERHGVGNGSDIGRMKRQQAFIASMINKVVSAGTLANPVRLYNFLDATTKSLITDKDFANIRSLASLGSSLKNIGLDHIKFITVPWEPYPPDHNRVQWKPEAKRLWQRIINDEPLGGGFDQTVVDAAHTPGANNQGGGSGGSAGASGGTGSGSPSGGSSPSSSPSDQAAVEEAQANGLCA